jgi:hypothetical protein
VAGESWRELSSDHFKVFYLNDERFARDCLDKAELYYNDIASQLGYPRYSEFWLWDKRVKIFIYPDHAAYLKATHQPQWSQGMADYRQKQVISYVWSSGFLESLLPHEIAHLIFRDFVGFRGEVPLWLDEGVAQWSEKAKRVAMRQIVRKKFDEDSLLTMNDMMRIDIRNISDKEKLFIRPTKTREGEDGVLFLSTEAILNAYYVQGFSLVDFLITRYGTDDFTYFCRQLRDGKSMEEALRFAYPNYIKSLAELEVRWREYVGSEEYVN